MQELVIQTWCDIDFIEDDQKVEGRRINWTINGKPYVLDVCQQHGLDITLVEIDNYVEKYGHLENAKPVKSKKKAAPAPVPAATAVATKTARVNPPSGAWREFDGEVQCRVETATGPAGYCSETFGTMQGLKMHQTRRHGLKATKK